MASKVWVSRLAIPPSPSGKAHGYYAYRNDLKSSIPPAKHPLRRICFFAVSSMAGTLVRHRKSPATEGISRRGGYFFFRALTGAFFLRVGAGFAAFFTFFTGAAFWTVLAGLALDAGEAGLAFLLTGAAA
jgi:hypothetical protein